ncbi:MAG: hypothetical protein AAGE59_00205 [Cyanobacteria bacterium P01_F01_bin.86]
MTSHQAQLQVLITEIESLLGQGTPRLPWAVTGEPSQQRRLLERALASLKAFHESGVSVPLDSQELVDAETRSLAETNVGAVTNSEAASQQMLQALLQEMQYLRTQAIQPLSEEVTTLQQRREQLQEEIRQLESGRSQLAESGNASPANPVWVNDVVDQLRSSLLEQLTPELKALQTQINDAPTLYGASEDPREIAAKLPQLHPQQRLDQLRQVQSQTDHLLLKLDANLRAVFESMEQSLQSYCDSLAQGLEAMHGLGQQGEVIFGAFINSLAQQLRQESSFITSSPQEDSAQLLTGENAAYETYDESVLEESLSPEAEPEDPLLTSIIDLDDVDLDAEGQSGEEITLFQLDEDITQLQLVHEDEIDELATDDELSVSEADEERTIIQTEPIAWDVAVGLASSEVTESADTSKPSTDDADADAGYAEEIDALYESLFGEVSEDTEAELQEIATEPQAVTLETTAIASVETIPPIATSVEDLDETLLGVESANLGWDAPETDETNEINETSTEDLTISVASDEAIAPFISETVDASLETLLEPPDISTSLTDSEQEDSFEAPNSEDLDEASDPESENILETFLGTEVAAELTPPEDLSLEADTITSLDDLLPATDAIAEQHVVDPFTALDETSEDTFIPAPPEEDLLASDEVESSTREIDVSLGEEALGRLNEDLSQLEEAASDALRRELSFSLGIFPEESQPTLESGSESADPLQSLVAHEAVSEGDEVDGIIDSEDAFGDQDSGSETFSDSDAVTDLIDHEEPSEATGSEAIDFTTDPLDTWDADDRDPDDTVQFSDADLEAAFEPVVDEEFLAGVAANDLEDSFFSENFEDGDAATEQAETLTDSEEEPALIPEVEAIFELIEQEERAENPGATIDQEGLLIDNDIDTVHISDTAIESEVLSIADLPADGEAHPDADSDDTLSGTVLAVEADEAVDLEMFSDLEAASESMFDESSWDTTADENLIDDSVTPLDDRDLPVADIAPDFGAMDSDDVLSLQDMAEELNDEIVVGFSVEDVFEIETETDESANAGLDESALADTFAETTELTPEVFENSGSESADGPEEEASPPVFLASELGESRDPLLDLGLEVSQQDFPPTESEIADVEAVELPAEADESDIISLEDPFPLDLESIAMDVELPDFQEIDSSLAPSENDVEDSLEDAVAFLGQSSTEEDTELDFSSTDEALPQNFLSTETDASSDDEDEDETLLDGSETEEAVAPSITNVASESLPESSLGLGLSLDDISFDLELPEITEESTTLTTEAVPSLDDPDVLSGVDAPIEMASIPDDPDEVDAPNEADETATFSLDVDLNLSLDSEPESSVTTTDNVDFDVVDELAGVLNDEADLAVSSEPDSEPVIAEPDVASPLPETAFALEGSMAEGYRLVNNEATFTEFIDRVLVNFPEPHTDSPELYSALPDTSSAIAPEESNQSSPHSGFDIVGSDDEGFSLALESESIGRRLDEALAEIPPASDNDFSVGPDTATPSPSTVAATANLEPISDEEMAELFPQIPQSANSDLEVDATLPDLLAGDEDTVFDRLIEPLERPEDVENDPESPLTSSLNLVGAVDTGFSAFPDETTLSTLYERTLANFPVEGEPLVVDTAIANATEPTSETGASSEEEAGPLSDEELAQLFPPTAGPTETDTATALSTSPEDTTLGQSLHLLDDVADRLDDLETAITELPTDASDVTDDENLDAITVDETLNESAIADIILDDIEIPPADEETTLPLAATLDEHSPETSPDAVEVSLEESPIVDFVLDDIEIPAADEDATDRLLDSEVDELFPPTSGESEAAITDLFITSSEVAEDDLEETATAAEDEAVAEDEIEDHETLDISPEATDTIAEIPPINDSLSDLLGDDGSIASTADSEADIPFDSSELADFDLSMEEISEADIENDEAFRSAFQEGSSIDRQDEDSFAFEDETLLNIQDEDSPDVQDRSSSALEAELAIPDERELDIPGENALTIEDELESPDEMASATEDALDIPSEISLETQRRATVDEQFSIPSLDALFEDEDEASLEAAFADEDIAEAEATESLEAMFLETTPENLSVNESSLDEASLEAAFAEDIAETEEDDDLEALFTGETSQPGPEEAASLDTVSSLDAAFAETGPPATDPESWESTFVEETPDIAIANTDSLDETALEVALTEDTVETANEASLDALFATEIPEFEVTETSEIESATGDILDETALETTFAGDTPETAKEESLDDLLVTEIPEVEGAVTSEMESVTGDPLDETPSSENLEALFVEEFPLIEVEDADNPSTTNLEATGSADVGVSPSFEEVNTILEDLDVTESAPIGDDSPPEPIPSTEAEAAVIETETEASSTSIEAPEAISARETAPVEPPDFLPDTETEIAAVEDAPSTSALLAAIPAEEPAAEEPELPPSATAPRDEWFLGLDFGTGGLSAVLMNRLNGAAHPLYWSHGDANISGDNTFRIPAVAALRVHTGSENPSSELRAVGISALIEAAENPDLQLINTLKPLLKVGIPHQTELSDSWEPVIQWSEVQSLPLQRLVAAVQALLSLVRPFAVTPLEIGAVGLGANQLHQVLDDLQGIIVGHPSSWPDNYCINLREAVLAARLVDNPNQIFFVEEAIAAILSGLPDPNDPPPQQIRQTQTLYQCSWQGGTVVISAGMSCTELGIVDLPHPLDAVSREDFFLRNLPYGGDALDLDIICQLLMPPERRKPRTRGSRSGGNWQPRFPETENEQWDSLALESVNLPQLAEPDVSTRVRLRQYLEISRLGQSLLDAARYLKLILQNQSQFQLELADQSWRVLRRDLESRVLVPYIQRLNQQLSGLLSQTGLSPQNINQVICTGGNVSFAAISRWLRQKFPNATIIQDTYPINRSPSCSRVAYGLANLCRYPQVLDVPRHQYSDYFLLHEIVRTLPDQPLPLDGILHLLEEQGINTDACRSRILAILEGHLPPGLIPDASINPYLSQLTLDREIDQELGAERLFTRQSGQIYMLNAPQRDRIRMHLIALWANKRQSIAEPLIAQLVVP